MLKGKFLLLLISFLPLGICYSQVELRGTVTDEQSGEPLTGVNVIIVGSGSGVATDIDGNYALSIPEGADKLQFSYTGYTTKEVVINSKLILNVSLKSGKELEEVVVVGYGVRSKAKLTAAVSSIDTKTLKKLPVPTVSNSLEGLASGLFVRQGSGEPGFSGSSYEVRNFGNALVIVDGAPANLDDLDPNEIESISVLKDAAAASVYGVQGGNGVILVTTRKGKAGKTELNYSNQFTQTAFTQYPDFLNSVDYATVLNEGLINAGQNPFYTAEEIDLYRSGTDPINYPNEDWSSLVFKDWGLQQRHNLNLTGGTNKLRYFVSAGFLDQGSNYTSDVLSYQQFNLRTNINAEVTKYLSFQVNLAGRRRLNEAPGYSAYNIFREMSRALPTNLAYYPDGTPARPSFSPNHVLEGIRDFNAGYYRSRNNNLDAKLSLEWDLEQIGVKGLKVKSYASLINNTFYNKEWGKSYELYTLNRFTGEYDEFIASPEGSFSETVLTQSSNYSNNYVVQQYITYDRLFKNHAVSGLLLGELQSSQGENFFGRRQDFQSQVIDQLFAGSNENKDASGGEFRENRLGLVGRFNYDYKSKYIVETSFRYDGSSKFAPENQWGFFPSVSAAWRLSEEPFFEGVSKFLPGVKIRGSVGTAGNDGTAAYQWLSGFVYNFFYAINETAIPTIDNTDLANRELTWETITTYDAGIDLEFFDRNLTLSFDYFKRYKDGVLAYASGSIPSTLGVGLAAQNFHEYSNEGYEMTTSFNKSFASGLFFSAIGNFSYSRETAEFIDEAEITDEFMRQNLTVTGGFTNLRRGYVSDGLFQSEEEIEAGAIQDNNGNFSLQPGDVRYVDLNADGVIDVQDQRVFGNGDKPIYNYSLNLSANYKNLSLSVLLTGALGYDIYIDGEAQSPLRNGFNGYTYQLDYWTPENTDARFPRITDGGFNENNYKYSDFWMRSGNHLRLRNVNLSYTLPKFGKGPAGFKDITIFATGNNLLVFKTYTEEFDPQMQSSTGWYYPQLKSFTFGVNVTL